MGSPVTLNRISIAPIKGMRIQRLAAAELTPQGIPGDRAFFLVDEQRRMVNGKRLGALMTIVPEHDREAGTLTLGFPDGAAVTGAVEAGERRAVTFFGLELQARPVIGPFSAAISELVGQELTLMERPPERPGVDRGAIAGVTLLGSASVERLQEVGREYDRDHPREGPGADPGRIDSRRFRMSLEIEGTAPHEEDGWVGREVRVGEAVVEVGGHVGRCAVTTRDPERGGSDLRTLHYLKAYRDGVPSEEPLPFGVYARIVRPGAVRVGDPVEPAPAA